MATGREGEGTIVEDKRVLFVVTKSVTGQIIFARPAIKHKGSNGMKTRRAHLSPAGDGK